MIHIRVIIKRSFIGGLVFLMVGLLPAPVFADPADTSNSGAHQSQAIQSASPANSPVSQSNGVDRPTGAAAATFMYNDKTGLWENEYYTWDPVSKQTTPKSPAEYTYNPTTKQWDTSTWQYITSKSAYVLTPLSVTTPPAGAITHGGPVVDKATAPQSQSTNAAADGTGSNAGQSQNGSAVNVGLSDKNSQALEFSTSGAITNQLDSSARTGNALVVANTTGGSATTGNALGTANVLNLLQSSSSLAGSGLTTFTTNLQGNVQGDLLIDPTALTQPANVDQQKLDNLNINSQVNGAIDNNINLGAVSGDASVLGNTTAGGAKTGNANAVADVMNMISSVVAANQSFLGIVNIYGDYTGNILVPQDTLNALLASNGPDTTNTATTSTNTSAAVTTASNQSITNNTNLTATSGTATEAENTTAGNATTGSALTNLTVLNLTGKKVIGSNSLLVFVNVLGKWVGVIMDAPTGSTAAALGGGISSNTSANTNAALSSNDNETITNNLNLNAHSGDATVARNTTAGNATTGSASASANIVNLTNSQLSLSNWFGVLFINVFGSWHGNFGAMPATIKNTTAPTAGGSANNPIKDMRVFRFVPSPNGATGLVPLTSKVAVASSSSTSDMTAAAAQAAQTLGTTLAGNIKTASPIPKAVPGSGSNMLSLPIIGGLAGLTFVSTERLRSNRKKSALSKKN